MAEAHSEGGELAGDAPDPSVSRTILNPRGMRCLLCAYDLSGIPADARCPECAAEISHTRQLLLSSQPEHTLRRLQRGTLAMLIGVGVQLVFGGVGSVAPGLLLMRGSGGVNTTALAIMSAVLSLVGLGMHATIAWGHWGVTTPLAGTVPAEWSRNGARVAVRTLTVILLVIAMGNLALGMYFVLDPNTSTIFDPNATSASAAMLYGGTMIAMSILGVLATAGEFLRFVFSSVYLGALSRRVPDPGTSRIARNVARFSVYLVVGSFAIGVVVFAGLYFASGWISAGVAAGIVGVCLFGGVLLVGVSALTLLILWVVAYAKFASSVSQIRKELARARRESAQIGAVAP